MRNTEAVTDKTKVELAPGLEKCFMFHAKEASYELSGISGRVPDWLRGDYVINGPARFERAGTRYKHWLDGDGMICSLRFHSDGIHFTNRFIDTAKLDEENRAGTFIFRTFGTAFPGDKLHRQVMLEPPVNVSVYRFASRLLAFGEQTLPIELDPNTLKTIGEFDFHGKLNDVTPFAAHPKFDPTTGHMFNFGVTFAAAKPTISLYEFDPHGRLLSRTRFPIELAHSNHDFGISAHHAVFFLSPLIMDFGKFLQQGASVMEALRWEPERGSYLLILPKGNARGKRAQPLRVSAGNGYCLHLINCFEKGAELVVDILELDAPVYGEYQIIPDLFSNVAPCRPVRYRINLETGTLIGRTAMAYDRTPDFPALNPACAGFEYSDFWMLGISEAGRPGRKFFNQLARGEWSEGRVTQVYQVGCGEYLGGEPVFIANPENAHEAAVIVEHFDTNAERCEFLIFDAFDIAEGPIAQLPLRYAIHPGFHASFHLA